MNFFTDNDDIRFLLNHYDLAKIAALGENDFSFVSEFDFAPKDAADALDNYRRVLELVGELSAEKLAASAEETDRTGNVLNEDGSVTYAPGSAEAMSLFGKAGLMGFTLPYRYGGLNMPTFVYTAANELVSRADASFMNLFGLQGIAETINSFASDEIKEEYLPRMASGEFSGAMALTEPDAGSDLQAVKTTASQDENGNWTVRGVKRFITNGCGHVLLVLARTEPGIADARGLSCLLVEKGPKVKVRRLENKLGIHGSPTCEIFFDDAPAKLIGQRQRGLISYVMALMNGARMGIAAQAVGIGEAALRAATEYAAVRRQFGNAIADFPAIREILDIMELDVQAARAVTYFSAFCVDMERLLERRLEFAGKAAPEAGEWRKDSRRYRGYNKVLTPFAKYYASEMSMRVANNAVSVLGGSGYMKDYPVERYLRDARITSIYEGTSQLQVVAAVAGVVTGTADEIVRGILDAREWPENLAARAAVIRAALADVNECVAFVKSAPADSDTRDRHARRLVDMALVTLVAALFCDQAFANEKKLEILDRWLWWKLPDLHADKERILQQCGA